MTTITLEKKLEIVSPKFFGEISDYLDYMIFKTKTMTKKEGSRKMGLLKGKMKMHDDFDAPVADFAEYM